MSALGRVLPAMTLLQAIVALGAFSLSVLAPQLDIAVERLGILNAVMFGVGAVASLFAGRLIRLFGDLRLASICLVAVALAMLCLLAGSLFGLAWALWPAVLLLGLAFGPETPASTAVLARLTTAAQRSLVFSVRQTGNQIGAMTGSLALPVLLVWHPTLPYAGVGAIAVMAALWCGVLARDARLAPAQAAGGTPGAAAPDVGALRDVLASRELRLLALALLAYSATQMCMNTFLMSFFVRDWRYAVGMAAQTLALLQLGGLAGRLFWGWFGGRGAGEKSLAPLLGALGLFMAASGAALVLAQGIGGVAIAVLAALTGFTASGWNGVMIAEVTRIAGPRRAGAIAGVVLMFGYAGLALAPLGFVAVAAAAGMATAFLSLLGFAAFAGVALMVSCRQGDGAAVDGGG